MSKRREQRRKIPFTRPQLMMATGTRNQNLRTTYLPYSDPQTGTLGWEVLVDGRADDASNVLVYMVPTADSTTFEVRVHATLASYPDPENDQLLSTAVIPPEMLRDDLE